MYCNERKEQEKKKSNYIQDFSDSSDPDHASAEYHYRWYTGRQKSGGDAGRIFRKYDGPVGRKQKSDPAK